MGETRFLVTDRVNIYTQHIRKPQHQQLALEEHLSTCGDWKIHMFSFF